MPNLAIYLLFFLAGAIFGVIVLGLVVMGKLGEQDLPASSDSEVGI